MWVVGRIYAVYLVDCLMIDLNSVPDKNEICRWVFFGDGFDLSHTVALGPSHTVSCSEEYMDISLGAVFAGCTEKHSIGFGVDVVPGDFFEFECFG